MKIVDRATFLTMPRGTLFVKIKPCIVEPLMLFAGATGSNDFVYREMVEIDSHDSGQFFDMIFDACEHKTRDTLPLDWDTDIHRDGLFDADQMFGVFEREEVASLISMLTNAYNATAPANLQTGT